MEGSTVLLDLLLLQALNEKFFRDKSALQNFWEGVWVYGTWMDHKYFCEVFTDGHHFEREEGAN